ncbi:hypothetical protein BDF21DRAFT_498290 [Thamnidium elegans]|nr:hypothetical protein BDF21DRAFT_498290 [Thamnidium elegans]
MDELPAEVYYGIFHYLSRPEIQAFSLVCRRLNEVTFQVINKMLLINDRKLRIVKVNLAQGKRRFLKWFASDYTNTYFKNGHLVRNLIIKSESQWILMDYHDFIYKTDNRSARFSRAEFLLLLEYLPNIEEIDFTESGYYTYYLSYLLDANLQHIKKIAPGPYEHGIFSKPDDFTRSDRFSWTDGYPDEESFMITNLLRPDNFSCPDHNDYLSACLKFCGTLTSLCLQYTGVSKDYNFSGVGILHMLSQFKNLKQLVFHNSYSNNSIMFRIQEFCPQLTELIFTSDNSDDFVQESPVKLNKRLQHLNIILESLTIGYTKYLTSYIEDGLKSVSIQVKRTGLYDWIDEVGMEDALKLMKNLGLTKDVSIAFSESDIPRATHLSSRQRTIKWFQVADAFKGNKNVLCSVKFCKPNSLQDYFEYSSSDKQLTLTRGWTAAHDILEGDSFTYRYNAPLSDLPFPTAFISTILPGIINRLDFDLGGMSVHDEVVYLKYALSNCINLHYLRIGEYTKIQGCPNQRNSEVDSILISSKMVYFICSEPTADALSVISSYLPNIELLVFANYSNDNVTWNLTYFKNLKRCYFLIQTITAYNREPLLFKFEYTDGKEQSYYYENGSLVRQIKRPFRTSYTIICKKDTDFTLCFELNKNLWNFDIGKLQENRYRIPHVPLYIKWRNK